MTRSTRPPGFNVIGNLTANNGLGVAARNVVDLIVARGFPVAAYNIAAGLGRDRHEPAYETHFVRSLADLPHAVNVLVLPVAAIPDVLPQIATRLDLDSYFNASLCYWELPKVPRRWIPALESLDALVATSGYMAHVYRCAVSNTAIVEGTLPVELPAIAHGSEFRLSRGLSEDAVVFLTSFDPLSDMSRKNPGAVVEAFLRGVADDARAHLVVRANNATGDGVERDAVARLKQLAGAHPRVIFHDAPLTYPEVLSLYAEIDVFVSLHRAEGLGLAIAETMTLGKPVIATAWSGSLSLADRSCACLVGYRLIPVSGTKAYDSRRLDAGTVWADADVGQAAAWMRRLCDDPQERARIGIAARQRMERYNEIAGRGAFLDELLALRTQPDDRIAHEAGPTRRIGAVGSAMHRAGSALPARSREPLTAGVSRVLRKTSLTRLFGGDK